MKKKLKEIKILYYLVNKLKIRNCLEAIIKLNYKIQVLIKCKHTETKNICQNSLIKYEDAYDYLLKIRKPNIIDIDFNEVNVSDDIYISIIIPAYNCDKYIGKCIESVKNQTYENIEIVIINDGSTDKTKEVISSYISKDSRIIYIEQKNSGPSIARNNGIDKSTGIVLILFTIFNLVLAK